MASKGRRRNKAISELKRFHVHCTEKVGVVVNEFVVLAFDAEDAMKKVKSGAIRSRTVSEKGLKKTWSRPKQITCSDCDIEDGQTVSFDPLPGGSPTPPDYEAVVKRRSAVGRRALCQACLAERLEPDAIGELNHNQP